MKTRVIIVGLALIAIVIEISVSSRSSAFPANFSAHYRILQTRILGLTNGHGYVLQDGNLVAETNINRTRVYCRSNQSAFDDITGTITVNFAMGTNALEHAILQTVPDAPNHHAATFECVAAGGFSGSLDLSIAFGRVVEITP